MDEPFHIDLDAYFKRIGYEGPRENTHAALAQLQLAHATTIPFENLDILLGKPIRLDMPSLQQKLIEDRRGGYCFEHNLLMYDVLTQLGFLAIPLAARVRFWNQGILPRTHMLLRVDIAGEPWLVDLGFGGFGLLAPIPLIPGQITDQFNWQFRIGQCPEGLLLQLLQDGVWIDLYQFTLEQHYLVDYEMGNHYISTNPRSPFVQIPIVQIPSPEVRHLLRGEELTTYKHTGITTTPITGGDELLMVLDNTFGLKFPPGTQFQSQSERLERMLSGGN